MISRMAASICCLVSRFMERIEVKSLTSISPWEPIERRIPPVADLDRSFSDVAESSAASDEMDETTSAP